MGRTEFPAVYNFESICYQNLEHSGGEGFEALLNRSSGRKLGFDDLLFMPKEGGGDIPNIAMRVTRHLNVANQFRN